MEILNEPSIYILKEVNKTNYVKEASWMDLIFSYIQIGTLPRQVGSFFFFQGQVGSLKATNDGI